MHLYLNFFAMHLKSQMQYKASFFMLIFGQFLASFTAFVGVYFMFLRFNIVEDFSFQHVLLCFAVVTMAHSLAEIFGRGFDHFPRMISNGEFDRALVRPRNIIFQILAYKIDFTRIGIFVQAIFIFCYAIPNSGITWTPDKILTLFLMVICGSIIFFCVFVIYAAFSFFTIEGLEFMNIFTHGGREFGRYPFSIYGKNILLFLSFVIPLALFQYYPLLYLLDREKHPFYMLTPLIGVLFIIPSYTFFRFGLRNYKSTGS